MRRLRGRNGENEALEHAIPLSASGGRLTLNRVPLRRQLSLADIAPHKLADPDQQQDRAVERPLDLVRHEAVEEGKAKALEDPDEPELDHCQPDQAADHAHHVVKKRTHVPFSSTRGR